MSATACYLVDTLVLRARRSGLHDAYATRSRRAIKQGVNRAARIGAKLSLQSEVKALAQDPIADAQLERFEQAREDELACQDWSIEAQLARFERDRQDWTRMDLELAADQLLNEAGDLYQEVESADEGDDRYLPLPLELQFGLPDWMIEKLEACNGSAFEYLSALEQKRPRTTHGLLAEEEREAA